MHSADHDDARRRWHLVVDTMVNVGQQETEVAVLRFPSGHLIWHVHFGGHSIDDGHDEPRVEETNDQAGQGVQRPLPEIHLVLMKFISS